MRAFLLLGAVSPAWADSPRQGISCAVAVSARPQLPRASESTAINCTPPAAIPPATSHDGYRRIEWTLDPNQPPPSSSSKAVFVAVHETSCTGGRDPIPHLQSPEIRYSRAAVVVTLWIEELHGPQTCPGNPVGHLRISLEGTLGNRQLYDGSTDPPHRPKTGEYPYLPPGR